MKHTQTIPHPHAIRTAEPIARSLPQLLTESMLTTIILLVALIQGLLYLSLQPPWQHYDEPTHFEYAALIAQIGRLPHPGDENMAMRRDIAASMAEHQFFRNVPNPGLLGDNAWIGISELVHPPTYYMLVSLPLRIIPHLDVTTQLYVARSVSVLLFLLTIAVTIGMLRDLTPEGHALRWAVPLAMVLLPPFVDLMTAVNNDAAAIAVFSLFLWGAVRIIRFGLNWRRLAWLFGAALIAALTKNTAGVALVLAPLVCLIAFWIRRHWRWRWLAAMMLVGCVAVLAFMFRWGDAAYWYRGSDEQSQDSATRIETPTAPLGSHAMLLELPAGSAPRYLSSPLLPQDVHQVAGRTITVGGWIWANRPVVASGPTLQFMVDDLPWDTAARAPVRMTTTPTFVSWTFVAPKQSSRLHYLFGSRGLAESERPLKLFLDGALIVEGSYPPDSTPTFDDSSARSGVWDGRRFTNLVRNPSGEQAWPRLNPWLDQELVKYAHRSPAQLIAAVFDVQRIRNVFVRYMVEPPLDGMILSFGWGNVQLQSPIWLYLSRAVALLALLGCLRWLAERRLQEPEGLRPALIFLALVGILVWSNTILRPLPLLGEYVVPGARYTFPAITVTMLAVVGGWWALWPHRLRVYATLALIGSLIVLNSVAAGTIVSFYRSIPLG